MVRYFILKMKTKFTSTRRSLCFASFNVSLFANIYTATLLSIAQRFE